MTRLQPLEINVIGSGRSLNNYPPEFFKNKINIGVNAVIKEYAEVLTYYMVLDIQDHIEWVELAKERFKDKRFFWIWKGIAGRYGVTENEATLFDLTDGEFAFGTVESKKLIRGFTVINSALNLAYLLGSKKINMYGVDMVIENKQAHYDDKDGEFILTESEIHNYCLRFHRMKKKVRSTVDTIRKKGVEVVNYGKAKT